MMKRIPSILFILIWLTAGCKFMGPQAFMKKKQPEPVVKRIQDEQLAKLVLTPKRQKLQVARDPFKPLFETSSKTSKRPVVRQDLKVIFIGTVKVEDEVVALLQVDSKKKFVRQHDVVNGYTIDSIDMDNVILTKGNQQMILKRSEVK